MRGRTDVAVRGLPAQAGCVPHPLRCQPCPAGAEAGQELVSGSLRRHQRPLGISWAEFGAAVSFVTAQGLVSGIRAVLFQVVEFISCCTTPAPAAQPAG